MRNWFVLILIISSFSFFNSLAQSEEPSSVSAAVIDGLRTDVGLPTAEDQKTLCLELLQQCDAATTMSFLTLINGSTLCNDLPEVLCTQEDINDGVEQCENAELITPAQVQGINPNKFDAAFCLAIRSTVDFEDSKCEKSKAYEKVCNNPLHETGAGDGGPNG